MHQNEPNACNTTPYAIHHLFLRPGGPSLRASSHGGWLASAAPLPRASCPACLIKMRRRPAQEKHRDLIVGIPEVDKRHDKLDRCLFAQRKVAEC